MNYIGKTFSRHYDVTSGPIDTKLNYSFIASNYVIVKQIWRKSDDICGNYKSDAFGAFLYCTNTTGTGSCSSLRISYKKLALVSSFQNTNFQFQSDHWLQRYRCIGNFTYYAYISGTGSAITLIRKTPRAIYKLYILCKFQLCSPYNGFWKLMLE